MNIYRLALRASLALAFGPVALIAQAPATKPSDCSKLPSRTETIDCTLAHAQTKTIFLTNVTTQNDAIDILNAIRNVYDPSSGLKVYLASSQNAIVVSTYPEELARIEALVHTLDIPHKTYRLTYTITELDANKPIGTEHIAMIAVDGQRTTVKQGDKIPVATGIAAAADSSSTQTQFTYLDIGLNFDASLSAIESGAILKTKVEQSSLGQPSTIAGVTEPVVRQTVIEGTSFLTPGKPVMLGSIDVPNSTHRFDIAVVMDAIH